MKLGLPAATLTAVATTTAAGQIQIQTVPIGNPGNIADSTGYGSVNYTYSIGRYEVTAGQYASFLNAVASTDTYGLYNHEQSRVDYGSGISRSGDSGSYIYSVSEAFINRPVNFVSFWDACRFSNWLHNGQPVGLQDASTTEDGAYTLTAAGISGNSITRNATALWAVTSEDEWYKAAYSSAGSLDVDYWLYATASDVVPGRELDDLSGNNANYYSASLYPIQSPYYTTTAGEFQSSTSAYGTFDQGGNVSEWNEARILGSSRGLRGGSFSRPVSSMRATSRGYVVPTNESQGIGFRVSQIPAPMSFVLLAIAGVAASSRRRRGGIADANSCLVYLPDCRS